ncbi:MAG: cyclase family protein [Bacteroidia bacterium]
MITNIRFKAKTYRFSLLNPIDISISLQNGSKNPNAFHIQNPVFEPFKIGNFVGSTELGGSVNCYNLHINPHGNGTHTECVGHITNGYTINQCLQQFTSIAQIISVEPVVLQNGDLLVTQDLVEPIIINDIEALVIRTLPNTEDKLLRNYSGKNPCYYTEDLCRFLAQKNILHLVIDLPSVDREEDDGKLLAHKAFWQYPNNIRKHATITEMAYIDNNIEDGLYVLQLMIAPFESDASPSKPILYKLIEEI